MPQHCPVAFTELSRDPIDQAKGSNQMIVATPQRLTDIKSYFWISRYQWIVGKAGIATELREHPGERRPLLVSDDRHRVLCRAALEAARERLVYVAQTIVHNTRGIDFRLDPAKRAELANILRPDVQRLVDHYGFKPAKKWLQSET